MSRRSYSFRRLFPFVAALLFFGAEVAQVEAQVGAALEAPDEEEAMDPEGDAFVFDFEPPEDAVGTPSSEPVARADEPHTLYFGDGTTLRGRLLGIDAAKDVIAWSRTDVSGPLPIVAGTVSSLTLGSGKPAAPSGTATVKFTGGDWITGDVQQIGSDSVTLKLPSGPEMALRRRQVEWIYFSPGGAAECYDGPTSLAGWISDGSWTFQEGALRARRPSAIGRHFEVLPDRCEYVFDIEQVGDQRAFSIVLRNSGPLDRNIGPGRVQIMFSGSDLRLWAQIGDEMKMEQVDLRQTLGIGSRNSENRAQKKRTVRYRILDDFPGGRIVVLIDGRKAAEWSIAKGAAGKNRGGLTFQPMVWNPDAQLSLTRIRVMPWDGALPSEVTDGESEREVDAVVADEAPNRVGELLGFDGTQFTFRGEDGENQLPAPGVRMVRFRRLENPPDEDPPVARLRLAAGGEFDVMAIDVKEGQMIARTAFCAELKVAMGDLSNISFPGMASAPDSAGDTLVFKTGDRLRGRLIQAGEAGSLLWQSAGQDASVQFAPGRIAGVILAKQQPDPDQKTALLVRFKNGDMLAGSMISLDGSSLQLQSVQAGRVAIPRDHLQAFYFANENGLPISEGSIDTDAWTNGEDFRRVQAQRTQRPVERTSAPLSPWRYFDGAYTYHRPDSAPGSPYNRSNPFLGRIVEALPQNVELSFMVAGPENPTFSVQLFSDPGSPGYMMQFHSNGIYLHDMGPRPRGGGVFQQQITFDGKLKEKAKRRHVRVMADRKSGRLVVVVDGTVVAQVVRKAGERATNLGQGVAFYPQMRNACTFSNLWLGPWDGQLPEAGSAGDRLPHSILLANGDEATGKILGATKERVQIETDVGELDLPTSRMVMSRLASSEPARGSARLRLVGGGTLTVSDFAVENGKITCNSAVAGKLELPLTALQEIAFANTSAKEGAAGD